MHRLWAPWRHAYVSAAAADAAGGSGACFLCDYGASADDARHGVVWRGRRWYAVLNAYPYSNGHLMLVLRRHHEGFEGLDSEEAAELAAALGRCESAIRSAYSPHGLNVGVNLGRAAGAGAVGHLHVHLVPRWNGDTNFMSTIADTRVLPESLESSYTRLHAAMERMSA